MLSVEFKQRQNLVILSATTYKFRTYFLMTSKCKKALGNKNVVRIILKTFPTSGKRTKEVTRAQRGVITTSWTWDSLTIAHTVGSRGRCAGRCAGFLYMD